MAIDPFKAFELYREIINEVGDLENIKSYSFTKYSNYFYKFNLNEEGDIRCRIKFSEIPSEELKHYNFPPVAEVGRAQGVFNLGYDINGEDSQFMKSHPGLLFNILKTILECANDFVKNNPDVILVIFEQNKNRDLEDELGQKMPLYTNVAYKNRPPGYRVGKTSIDGAEGIYIGPIFKNYPKIK